ncbi:MAG: hypothetical protein ACK5AQ_07350, partial [Bacteroidota bacterium]
MLKQKKSSKSFVPVETLKSSASKDRAKKKIHTIKLTALLDVTKAINNNASVEKLFQIYQDILVNELKIGRLALYINNQKWMCALRY